jgi:hypothetical protein
MSRDKKIQAIRNEAILNEYNILKREKVGAAQKYSYAAILEILSQKFFLLPETVMKIVGKTKRQKNNEPR